jgi:hypothetical protein
VETEEEVEVQMQIDARGLRSRSRSRLQAQKVRGAWMGYDEIRSRCADSDKRIQRLPDHFLQWHMAADNSLL